MLLVPIVSRLAKRYRLVDAPGLRKVHKIPIPRIGGIVFWVSTLALVLPVFFLNNKIGQSFRDSRTEFIVLLTSASFIFAVGLFDDLRSVRGYIKLLCLIAASLAICASGATIRSISVGSWFVLELGWAAWPLAVVWIITITVGINFIDGLDGLAAGIAAIVCGSILLLALWYGQAAMVVLMLALLGSVTGFLFFNFYPAKIFMGDCGSMFLGFLIGASSLVCQTKTATFVGLAIPLLVMGVPIFDTGIVFLGRRIIRRCSMFTSDRNHLHHRLLDLGLRHRTVVIVIYAVTAICASIGVFMLTTEGEWSVGLLVGGLLLLFSMFACLHGRRYRGILLNLKRNWAIAHEVRIERRSFENAQVRMRESRSFRAWWETVCFLGKQMHFQSIELWKRRNGVYVNTYVWNAPEGKITTDKTVEFSFPLYGNGTAEREIRVRTSVNGYLELNGRQAMLLARLMDGFPPPDKEQESEELDLFNQHDTRSTIKEKAGDLLSDKGRKN
ncbi:Undecaprenyl-phosphate alpha-N-acetylglucosaminyl 1-phosphate transferase [subsurface metagenome]